MKTTTRIIVTSVFLLLYGLIISGAIRWIKWWNAPRPAQTNHYQIKIPPGMTAAINKMGPLHQYRISPSGRLDVHTGDDRWRQLKYKSKEAR